MTELLTGPKTRKRRSLIPVAGAALAAAGGIVYLNRPRLKNFAVLLLAARQPNAANSRGVKVHFRQMSPGWIPLTLQADLGPMLSEVTGEPIEAAAFSRFGGFRGRRPYSDFLDPASPYYQMWTGAYVVFDNDRRRHFGFDDQGTVILDDALNVLEADQRLVFTGAGCDRSFPEGRRTRPDTDTLVVRQVSQGGGLWSVLSGQADTWSIFHHGFAPGASRHSSWLYGTVPPDVHPTLPDWPPIRYYGQFWMRYVPAWNATCAKFYLYPEWQDPSGVTLRWGDAMLDELQTVVEGIEFRR